jgi:hypothetical protein
MELFRSTFTDVGTMLEQKFLDTRALGTTIDPMNLEAIMGFETLLLNFCFCLFPFYLTDNFALIEAAYTTVRILQENPKVHQTTKSQQRKWTR